MRPKLGFLGRAIAVWVPTFCQTASAALITVSESYRPALPIPDYDPAGVGVSDTRTFRLPGVAAITSLEVTLNIQGGYNGDYYVYIQHDGALAVLLNRVGKTTAHDFGYSDSGFDVTFNDRASNGDIHPYQGVSNPLGLSLGGDWEPDGRNVDPNLVTEGSVRVAFLSLFNGKDPNGNWTLYLVDNSPLGQGTLESWSLNVTANVVPESAPGCAGLLTLVITALLPRLRPVRTPTTPIRSQGH